MTKSLEFSLTRISVFHCQVLRNLKWRMWLFGKTNYGGFPNLGFQASAAVVVIEHLFNFRGGKPQIFILLYFSTLHNASFRKRFFRKWTTSTIFFWYKFLINRATGNDNDLRGLVQGYSWFRRSQPPRQGYPWVLSVSLRVVRVF